MTTPTHFSLPLLFFFLLWSPFSGTGASVGVEKHERINYYSLCERKKMFVFGDSYVDTGNWDPSISTSWKFPYGITFPGYPAGRFSDGLIITDYIASYLKIGSPVPYERRSKASSKELQYGMNFAYGGTGVFDTHVPLPNLTSQVNLFKDILIMEGNLYKSSELYSSVALISASGNDYADFLRRGHPEKSLQELTKPLINKLVEDLKLIHSLGVPKIAILSMGTVGCVPSVTITSGFRNCSENFNNAALYHNLLLHKSLLRLNREVGKSVYYLLDVYGVFQSSLMPHNLQQGPEDLKYENPLVPCCKGVSSDYECGGKEGNETKYTICNNPEQVFFWDNGHPTQFGWHKVFLAILSTLRCIH